MQMLRVRCHGCGGWTNHLTAGLCGCCRARPWEWKPRPLPEPRFVEVTQPLRGEPGVVAARRSHEEDGGGAGLGPAGFVSASGNGARFRLLVVGRDRDRDPDGGA